MGLISCEQVSSGHPDKLADQIADAVCTDCVSHDPDSRVAIECMIKNNRIVIAGELTSKHRPDYRELVNGVFDGIGRERCGYDTDFDIEVLVSEQSPDIAKGVDIGGAGDQGIVYGYATNETPELLPIPYVVATKFLRLLEKNSSLPEKNSSLPEKNSSLPDRKHRPMLKADAKAQVSFDYGTGKISTFLCSVQHSENADISDFRGWVEALMYMAASEYGLNTDFKKLVNPAGRFVIGGPFADCGLTGRKLACDTYGGVGRVGGGSISGKDCTKVDRSGAYMARKIARDLVLADYADKCEIQIAYAIGMAEPVSVSIDCFGTEAVPIEFLQDFVRDTYDLTPRGIIKALDLLNVDYTKVSTYGQFTNPDMPWEK